MKTPNPFAVTPVANPALLIGRTTELALLEEQFSSDALSIVCVIGDPGMGKTSLVKCFAARLAGNKSAFIVSGRAVSKEMTCGGTARDILTHSLRMSPRVGWPWLLSRLETLRVWGLEARFARESENSPARVCKVWKKLNDVARLTKKRLVWIIDEANQTSDQFPLGAILKAVEDEAEHYDRLLIIVAGYLDLQNHLRHHHKHFRSQLTVPLGPFTTDEIQELIDRGIRRINSYRTSAMDANAAQIASAIHAETLGHPFLTLSLCNGAVENAIALSSSELSLNHFNYGSEIVIDGDKTTRNRCRDRIINSVFSWLEINRNLFPASEGISRLPQIVRSFDSWAQRAPASS